MKINERIRSLREDKKLSQDYVADQLSLSQSQYSRRENGEIPISSMEIEKISSILKIKISEIYGELSTTETTNDIIDKNLILDKLIIQYEKRIEDKDFTISLLEKQIKLLSKGDPPLNI